MSSNYTSYKNELLHRYWKYQKENYPDWEKYFDHPRGLYSRPPVFLRSESWRNVIINPDSDQKNISKLLSLIPKSEEHKWFRSMNSSQALSLSIFGNLKIHDALHYLSELEDDDGHNLFKEAEISSENFVLEYKVNYLGEPWPTSLDGFFSGDYQTALEFKFTESGIGSCSRPRLLKNNPKYEENYCNGSYSIQNNRETRCSLSEKGILYWKFVPIFFKWKNDDDLDPCPLNFNYQLVRNILAAGVKPNGSASNKNGCVILIYDDRNPAFREEGRGFEAYKNTRKALRDPGMLRKCSWQRILQLIRRKNIIPWLLKELSLKYGL